jgi:hypothetical protein
MLLQMRGVAQAVSMAAMAAPVDSLPDEPQAKTAQSSNVEQTSSISGTVTDTNDDIVPGATVTLLQAGKVTSTTTANADGAFRFAGLQPGVTFRIAMSAQGFVTWTSNDITLDPGQFYIVTQGRMPVQGEATSITVSGSNEQIALEQIHVAEQQRVLGFIPNFYVVYDKNPVPLPAKLKFKLAWRVLIDPINIVGAAALAGMNQAGDTPNYQQGAKGYGQRFGAVYADGFTDLILGGAVLPALLHQDPRYYYQGTGTAHSRAFHAMSAPFVCMGDNGKRQINYSSIGGDLFSASLSNLYYPDSNRGASLVFTTFLLDTGTRVASTLVQEFVIRKLTPSAKKHGN